MQVSAIWSRHTIKSIFSSQDGSDSFFLALNIYSFLFYNSLEYFMFIKFINLCLTLLYSWECLQKLFIQSIFINICWQPINLFISSCWQIPFTPKMNKIAIHIYKCMYANYHQLHVYVRSYLEFRMLKKGKIYNLITVQVTRR